MGKRGNWEFHKRWAGGRVGRGDVMRKVRCRDDVKRGQDAGT